VLKELVVRHLITRSLSFPPLATHALVSGGFRDAPDPLRVRG
jgi:hypothetical protein